MIIRIMARKEASFRQLLAYVTRDASDARFVLSHNLMDTDLGAIATEFETNAKLLRAHVNGTVMFHDILSITRSKSLGLERQKELLAEIARDYIARRAPDHLVFATLHDDHARHLHYHFVISANAHGEWKRAHLSKPELRKLQFEMEARVMTRYPELEQKPAMNRKASGPRLSKPGHELLRRTGKVPERQRVTAAVAGIFGSAQSMDDLFTKLTDARVELYQRGKSVGVRDLETERNHRLATLGLADAFKAMGDRLKAAEAKALSTTLNVQAAVAKTPARTQITPSPPPIKPPTLLPRAHVGPVQQPASNAHSKGHQEDHVDVFQLALNGIGAVADALSLAPGSAKPVEIEKQKVKAAVTKTTAPASSQAATAHQAADQQPQAPALTEAERIAQERLADIAETRQQQDQQLGQQQGSRLNR